MSSFRILSLDGGGTRGAYSAGALVELEKQINGSIIDYFDLVIGTSTGGIIAIGLGLGKSPSELADLYLKKGRKIFSATGLRFLPPVRWLVNKYKSNSLKLALHSVLRERKLGESRRPLVVASYNASSDNIHLFKTYHHKDHTEHYNKMAIEIAMATSAAPTFFAAHDLPLGKESEMQTFLDGGVCANCPALVGVTEAVRYFHVGIDQIEMLSIGTTYKPFKIGALQKFGGPVVWSLGVTDLFMGAQMANIVGTTRTLLGIRPDGTERFQRITRRTTKRYHLDDAGVIPNMIRWGGEDAQKKWPFLEHQFFNKVVPAFKPIKPVTN